jgi:transcriptional regulator with XRE-family HTH domain
MADGGRSLADIGKRIVLLREALGYGQGAFAQLTGLTQSGLSNYEAGTRRPEIDKAIQIVQKTGVTLDWIYLGDRAGLPQRLLAQLAELDSRQTKAG